MKRVAVIGEGAWGSAIALLLANNGLQVDLWCHDPAVAKTIAEKRKNERYFPDFTFPDNIQPVTDFSSLQNVTYIFEAVPVRYMRSVFTHMKPYVTSEHVVIVMSKGMENDTLLFPLELINEVLNANNAQAVLAGPSFASDLAQKNVTGVSLAVRHEVGKEIQALLNNDYFHAYITTDIPGVQAGAALKNVIALGMGIAEGAGFSDNTKALLMTKGLEEIASLAELLGGKRETIYGLSGVGDLFLSSMCSQGRNASLGREIGAGNRLADINTRTGVLPESANTLKSLYQLMSKRGLTMPLCEKIYRVVYESADVSSLLHS
jgi:glycerol-3-phosphate dehydrogenase (NAD(P)+)